MVGETVEKQEPRQCRTFASIRHAKEFKLRESLSATSILLGIIRGLISRNHLQGDRGIPPTQRQPKRLEARVLFSIIREAASVLGWTRGSRRFIQEVPGTCVCVVKNPPENGSSSLCIDIARRTGSKEKRTDEDNRSECLEVVVLIPGSSFVPGMGSIG